MRRSSKKSDRSSSREARSSILVPPEPAVGRSFLGGTLPAVNRDLESDPFRATLHSSAYAGGIDFRHEWGNRSWAVFGDAEMSRVQGSTSAITTTQRRSNHFFQQPDAHH